MEHYSAIKKNEIMPFAATWMNLDIIILSEISQTEKDKHYMISLTCGILKNSTNELIYKIGTESQTRKQIYGYQRGRGRGGINQEYGINQCTLPYIK